MNQPELPFPEIAVNKPDPIGMPHDPTRELMGGPLEIELRGYEVARRTAYGLQIVQKYRPNEQGRKLAIADATALNVKYPGQYRVRAIVSLEPPEPSPTRLTLDADFVAPEER